MNQFRMLFVVLCACLVAYTAVVAANHGFGLLPIFFHDIAAMGWPGKFNIDFTCFLTLSAMWVAWRHQFAPVGLGLAVPAFFGGALFLTAYIFIVSRRANDDVTELFLGAARVNS